MIDKKALPQILIMGSLALGLMLSARPAYASLIINSNGNGGGVQATPEAPLDGGPGFPCTTCTSNPVTTYGYTSGAQLIAADAGLYTFTFEGSGNSQATNTFSLNGTTVFTSVPPGGTGATSTPDGTTISLSLAANTSIAFGFGSSTGCSVTAGTASSTAGCDYLVALDNSTTTPGATGPQSTAWLGFSDGVTAGDSDYQDMVVHVTEQVPEPTSLALFGVGLTGLGFVLRRRKAV